MWGCGGGSAVQPHSMGGVRGGRGGTHTGTHTHTHTGTYTQMLHLPFSDLPLKKCPNLCHPTPHFMGYCGAIFFANIHWETKGRFRKRVVSLRAQESSSYYLIILSGGTIF